MTLQRGSAGAEVEAWQIYLRSQGYALTADSDFGPATEQATITWQRSRKLTADGIVGPASQAAAGITLGAPVLPAAAGQYPAGGTTAPGAAVPGRKTVAAVRGIERLSAQQLADLDAAAAAIGVPLDWLAAVISFETGGSFSPSILNAAGSRAVGLIQFMPATAQALLRTTTPDEATRRAAAMSFGEQLRLMVVPYFRPYAGRLKTLDDLYLAVFYPAFISKQAADVVARKEGPNAAVYRQNAGFDKAGRGYITKADITSTIRKVLDGAAGVVSFDGVLTGVATAAKRSALPLLLLALGGGAVLWMSQQRRRVAA